MTDRNDAEIDVTVADARRIAEATARHMAGHGARLTVADDAWRIDFGLRGAVLALTEGGLRVRATGADPSLLREMQVDIAGHLAEFGGPALPDWTGGEGAVPLNFRLMRVEAVTDLTPLMRRVRLSGEALLRYDRMDAMHVKLLVPPPGSAPVWPSLDADGRFRRGTGLVRKYTIRRIDVAAGWMDIDFVLHTPAGPASAWAASAKPGDVIGLIGPGGAGIDLDGPLLLAGDETALPAIARGLEALPSGGSAVTALIEVADRREEQPIVTDANVVWLHRGDAEPGARLAAAVAEVAPDTATTVWAGCEFTAFVAIRRALRGALAHPRERHLVTAYWRRGTAGDRPFAPA